MNKAELSVIQPNQGFGWEWEVVISLNRDFQNSVKRYKVQEIT